MVQIQCRTTFATDEVEAVICTAGFGCLDSVIRPVKCLEQGKLPADSGRWDPSCRRHLKTNENGFTLPLGCSSSWWNTENTRVSRPAPGQG